MGLLNDIKFAYRTNMAGVNLAFKAMGLPPLPEYLKRMGSLLPRTLFANTVRSTTKLVKVSQEQADMFPESHTLQDINRIVREAFFEGASYAEMRRRCNVYATETLLPQVIRTVEEHGVVFDKDAVQNYSDRLFH